MSSAWRISITLYNHFMIFNTGAEFISFVLNLANVTISSQFIVTIWLCIFVKFLLSCLFMVPECWDYKVVTNYKNPFGCIQSSLTYFYNK